MKRLCWYLILFLFSIMLIHIPLHLQAQQSFTLKGIIVQAKTNARQAKVEITNLTTHTVRLSDDQGMFTIPASLGDSLLFSKADFTLMKQAVTNSNDVVIYLQPVVILNTVTIKGQSIKQDQQATMDAYRSKGVYYNGKPSVLSSIASPVNALYEAFGKEPRRARRFNNYIKEENESIQINQRYNKSLVKRITGLNDEETSLFMDTYRPAYADMVKWNDYDLINYVKRSLIGFNNLKTKPTTPLQKSNP